MKNNEFLETATVLQKTKFNEIKNNINIKIQPVNTISLNAIKDGNSPYYLEIKSS